MTGGAGKVRCMPRITSPLAAAWYLHRHDGIPLAEAYARIREVRPRVEEAREWIGNWQSLESDP